MFFASDNGAAMLPQVMDALLRANTGGAMPYGADAETARAKARLREIFEAPEAAVYFVATGTAANALALATLCQPFETVFCTPTAHIHEDECNAPEFYTGGAKLSLVGREDVMTPDALRAAIDAEETRGVHGPQRGAVSITSVTERGAVYTLEELKALTGVAKAYELPCHLDGARFANAIVRLGCSAAQMSWQAGFDAVSFGGTKNGCAGVEAVIFFDPAKAWEFELRRKRGGHLFSKYRFLGAQMAGYLEGTVWTEAARTANVRGQALLEGMAALEGAQIIGAPEANLFFARLPRAVHQRLEGGGVHYYVLEGDVAAGDPDELLLCRFVTSWSTTETDVARAIELARG